MLPGNLSPCVFGLSIHGGTASPNRGHAQVEIPDELRSENIALCRMSAIDLRHGSAGLRSSLIRIPPNACVHIGFLPLCASLGTEAVTQRDLHRSSPESSTGANPVTSCASWPINVRMATRSKWRLPQLVRACSNYTQPLPRRPRHIRSVAAMACVRQQSAVEADRRRSIETALIDPGKSW